MDDLHLMWAPPMQSLTHLGQNPKWLGLPAWEFFANPLVCSPFNGAGRCNGAVELNAAESIGIGFIPDKIPISPSSNCLLINRESVVHLNILKFVRDPVLVGWLVGQVKKKKKKKRKQTIKSNWRKKIRKHKKNRKEWKLIKKIIQIFSKKFPRLVIS